MATKRRTRKLVIATGLVLGLAATAATAAQAAPRRQATWSEKIQTAARLWLGGQPGSPSVTRGKSDEATAGAGLGVAGIFKLKQHVDNPAQAAMKDDGE